MHLIIHIPLPFISPYLFPLSFPLLSLSLSLSLSLPSLSLGSHVSLQVTIDPLHPQLIPECTPLGPTEGAIVLHSDFTVHVIQFVVTRAVVCSVEYIYICTSGM